MNLVPRVDLGDLPAADLSLGAGNLLELNDGLQRVRDTESKLKAGGLNQTLVPEQHHLWIRRQDEPLLQIVVEDQLGQPLTRSRSDSDGDLLDRLNYYFDVAVRADVLWIIASPPAREEGGHVDLFLDDLRILRQFLVDVLRARTTPGAVAVVLTKIDTLSDDWDSFRRGFGEERLLAMFQPLFQALANSNRRARASARIEAAALVPLTSFGFGRGRRVERRPVDGKGVGLEDAEEEWILPQDVSCAPVNLDTLLCWTMMASLRLRAGHRRLREHDPLRLAQALEKDVRRFGGWYLDVPLG